MTIEVLHSGFSHFILRLLLALPFELTEMKRAVSKGMGLGALGKASLSQLALTQEFAKQFVLLQVTGEAWRGWGLQ